MKESATKPPEGMPAVPGPVAAAANAQTPPLRRKRRHEGGRVSKLTTKVGRAIVAAIAAGNFPSVAARLAGVSPSTLDTWLRRGGEGRQPYADFADAFLRAELELEAESAGIVLGAGSTDWRARERYMAKRWPERWSDHAARRAVFGLDDDGQGVIFNIQINLDPEAVKKPAAIPTVTAEDAQVIEAAAPSTKV